MKDVSILDPIIGFYANKYPHIRCSRSKLLRLGQNVTNLFSGYVFGNPFQGSYWFWRSPLRLKFHVESSFLRLCQILQPEKKIENDIIVGCIGRCLGDMLGSLGGYSRKLWGMFLGHVGDMFEKVRGHVRALDGKLRRQHQART